MIKPIAKFMKTGIPVQKLLASCFPVEMHGKQGKEGFLIIFVVK